MKVQRMVAGYFNNLDCTFTVVSTVNWLLYPAQLQKKVIGAVPMTLDRDPWESLGA
jgi:hypothetical protein